MYLHAGHAFSNPQLIRWSFSILRTILPYIGSASLSRCLNEAGMGNYKIFIYMR